VAAKNKGKSHLTHEQMQRVLLGAGADPVQVWMRASPRQRQILKHRANQRGVTPAGLIQGGPRALQERSPRGIRQEAVRRIGSAYAPAATELDEREKRILNLDVTRQQDEEAYRNWEMTQQQRLTAASSAASQVLQDTLAGLAQEAQGLQNDVDPLVQAQLGPEHQHSVANVLLEQVAAARDRSQGAESSKFLEENVQASGQARAARRASETSASLADVNTERKTLAASKRADTIKEIARLADNEIGKAQGNRDFAAALQKLGIDRAKVGLDVKKEKNDQRNEKADRRLKQIDQQLKRDTLDETTRHHLEQEKADLLDGKGKPGKTTNRFGVKRTEARENRGTFQNMVYRLRYGSLSKQAANAHPLLARAAAAWVKGQPLDPQTLRGIRKIYGFDPPSHKAKKRLPPSGDRRPGQRGPGANTS
jgi:hypothetical protein